MVRNSEGNGQLRDAGQEWEAMPVEIPQPPGQLHQEGGVERVIGKGAGDSAQQYWEPLGVDFACTSGQVLVR